MRRFRDGSLIRVALLSAVVMAGPGRLLADDGIQLKAKLKGPSNVYATYESDTLQKMMGPDGKEMEVKGNATYGLLMTVTPDGDQIKVSGTFDRLAGMMSFNVNMTSRFDSDNPDAEDASPDYRAAFMPILNLPLTMTIDADGKCVKVAGGDVMREKLSGLGPQNFIATSLREGDLIDQQLGQNIGEYPYLLLNGQTAKPGDTWTVGRKEMIQQVGRTKVTYKCKLDRMEKDLATISFTGTVEKDADEKPAEGKRLGKIDGTVEGTATYDAKAGVITAMSRRIKAKIEVPPWFTRDENAPLMKVDVESSNRYSFVPAGDRLKEKAEIAKRIADARAKAEAEEAAEMGGPVEPVTAANAPEPWLQWGGPNRNFQSGATGLANRWPKEGPKKLWERPLGDGYSMVLCDGDTLYTQYSLRNKANEFEGDEVVVALDAKTGKTKWEHKYPAPWPKDLQMEFGPGPHSTPIVVGDRLFTVGTTAKMFCLDKSDGEVIWSVDLLEKYDAAMNMRGYGSSPLAMDGKILLPVSKDDENAVMAFNQSDGTVAWHSGKWSPGYASLISAEAAGIPQLIAFSGEAVMGLDPKDGRQLWSVDHPTQWGANISTPVWSPSDNMVFVSSAYGMGARGIQVEKAGSQLTAREVWMNPKMKIQHADAVRIGDYVYGSSGDFGPAFLACINAKTGEIAWRKRGISKATLIGADGKLIVLDEDGTLYLVKATPEKFQLLGKLKDVCEKTAWTAPTLSGRTLYLRDRKRVIAFDLGQ